MFTMYVLKSEKDGKLYVGSTGDLSRRLEEHNRGGVTSTRNRKPLKLIYKEEFVTAQDAQKRERYFKGGGKARALLKELINNTGD